jgi:hypothetical protein
MELRIRDLEWGARRPVFLHSPAGSSWRQQVGHFLITRGWHYLRSTRRRKRCCGPLTRVDTH